MELSALQAMKIIGLFSPIEAGILDSLALLVRPGQWGSQDGLSDSSK